MSPKSTHRPSTNSRHSSGYPKAWSDWAWDKKKQCKYRAQEVKRGEWIYEWDEKGQQAAPGSPETYSEQDEYTTVPDPLSAATTFEDVTASAGPPKNFPSPAAEINNRSSFNKDQYPQYTVHREKEFKFGRVLKVLWSEPKGSGGGTGGGTEESSRVDDRGHRSFEKLRRFVIISATKGHCICLPIMSYEGRGTTKPGVHPQDHAIIYTDQPELLKGELTLQKTPIRVIADTPRHRLDSASRLNYAKVYTLEYNVKVWFIGKVDESSEWWLATNYNQQHPPLAPRGIPPSSFPAQMGYNARSDNSTPSYNPTPFYPPNQYAPAAFPQNPPAWPQQGMLSSQWPGYSPSPSYASSNWISPPTPYQSPPFQGQGDVLGAVPEAQETHGAAHQNQYSQGDIYGADD